MKINQEYTVVKPVKIYFSDDEKSIVDNIFKTIGQDNIFFKKLDLFKTSTKETCSDYILSIDAEELDTFWDEISNAISDFKHPSDERLLLVNISNHFSSYIQFNQPEQNCCEY